MVFSFNYEGDFKEKQVVELKSAYVRPEIYPWIVRNVRRRAHRKKPTSVLCRIPHSASVGLSVLRFFYCFNYRFTSLFIKRFTLLILPSEKINSKVPVFRFLIYADVVLLLKTEFCSFSLFLLIFLCLNDTIKHITINETF